MNNLEEELINKINERNRFLYERCSIKDLKKILNEIEENIKTVETIENLLKRINKAIEILKLCNSECAKETIEILKGED